MQLFLFIWFFYNPTCFGYSLRPSSGIILQTVVAATGMQHRYGVSESRVEVLVV